jgi:hypothetical protein
MKLKKHWDLVALILCWSVFFSITLCIKSFSKHVQLSDFGISILHGPIGVRSFGGVQVMAENLFIRIIITLLGVFIASLVGSIILRLAAKWQASIEVSFSKAYATVFIVYLIQSLLLLSPEFGSTKMRIILVPFNFFVYALVVSLRLPVNLRRALLITVAVVAIGVAIAIAGILIAAIVVLPLEYLIS